MQAWNAHPTSAHSKCQRRYQNTHTGQGVFRQAAGEYERASGPVLTGRPKRSTGVRNALTDHCSDDGAVPANGVAQDLGVGILFGPAGELVAKRLVALAQPAHQLAGESAGLLGGSPRFIDEAGLKRVPAPPIGVEITLGEDLESGRSRCGITLRWRPSAIAAASRSSGTVSCSSGAASASRAGGPPHALEDEGRPRRKPPHPGPLHGRSRLRAAYAASSIRLLNRPAPCFGRRLRVNRDRPTDQQLEQLAVVDHGRLSQVVRRDPSRALESIRS